MSRLLDMIRTSSLPSHMMQIAARGALSVPPHEMIEILVYLVNHNKIFSHQAGMTLAGWDESASKALAADPKAPKEVLDYWIDRKNLRPVLLPVLLENPSVSQAKLVELAASASREMLEVMLKSERVTRSHIILDALKLNPNAAGPLKGSSEGQAESAAPEGLQVSQSNPEMSAPVSVEVTPEFPGSDPELDEEVANYLTANANEIAAEGEKPFQPIGGLFDLPTLDSKESPHSEAVAVPAATETAPHEAAGARKAIVAHKKTALSHDEERGSALQKISKLDVQGRIQLAFKGNKEERSILIRDGTRLVAQAVLDSPKVTDGEVERFAGQKNVLEAVLRGIALKRRFIKNYIVVRNLVSNPRTPIDLSLGLMKNLLVADLKNLSGNREVSETVSKLALRMFQQKKNPSKNSMD